MTKWQIIIIILVLLLLGIIILPLFNRSQFKKLPPDQQILAIMKQAKGLVFFKNVSSGRKGILYYVKNKRKILAYPWVIDENGKMLIVKENPFDNWDYPEEKAPLNDDEVKQARDELIKYSKKSAVKLVFNDEFKNDITE